MKWNQKINFLKCILYQNNLLYSLKHKNIKHMKKIVINSIFILSLILLSGCADTEIVKTCLHGHTYGFWGGLWHGMIAPFDFIGMLIWDDVTMYAPNNNGGWYAFGFLLGSGGWGFLATSKSSK